MRWCPSPSGFPEHPCRWPDGLRLSVHSTDGIPRRIFLTKTADGNWAITIYLSPGRTLYQFSVDGISWLDPSHEGRGPNGWGSEYFIRDI